MQQFLYTFRYFCTPQDFLHFLLDRISSTLCRYAWCPAASCRRAGGCPGRAEPQAPRLVALPPPVPGGGVTTEGPHEGRAASRPHVDPPPPPAWPSAPRAHQDPSSTFTKIYRRSLCLLQAWVEDCYSVDFTRNAGLLARLADFVSSKVAPGGTGEGWWPPTQGAALTPPLPPRSCPWTAPRSTCWASWRWALTGGLRVARAAQTWRTPRRRRRTPGPSMPSVRGSQKMASPARWGPPPGEGRDPGGRPRELFHGTGGGPNLGGSVWGHPLAGTAKPGVLPPQSRSGRDWLSGSGCAGLKGPGPGSSPPAPMQSFPWRLSRGNGLALPLPHHKQRQYTIASALPKPCFLEDVCGPYAKVGEKGPYFLTEYSTHQLFTQLTLLQQARGRPRGGACGSRGGDGAHRFLLEGHRDTR